MTITTTRQTIAINWSSTTIGTDAPAYQIVETVLETVLKITLEKGWKAEIIGENIYLRNRPAESKT